MFPVESRMRITRIDLKSGKIIGIRTSGKQIPLGATETELEAYQIHEPGPYNFGTDDTTEITFRPKGSTVTDDIAGRCFSGDYEDWTPFQKHLWNIAQRQLEAKK